MYKIFDESKITNNFEKRDGDFVMFSSLTKFESPVPFKNFAIKYVINENETYTVNGNKYILGGGEYLLCNKKSEGQVFIDSNKIVKGICIDIVSDKLAEVVASFRAPDTAISDMSLGGYFDSDDFLENQYLAKNTKLGSLLRKLDSILVKNPYERYQFDDEFYFKLCEGLLLDHIPIHKQFQSIRSIKSETKKDLLRKLSRSKYFIDANFSNPIDVGLIANQSQISLYHFYRLFKQVYGISPYQYLKQKRMDRAYKFLKDKDIGLSEIALSVGYADIFSFSKAYKQIFGKPPSSHYGSLTE